MLRGLLVLRQTEAGRCVLPALNRCRQPLPRLALPPAAGRPRKGSVKLVFEALDGEEVHFERAIKPTGAGADSFTSEVCVAAAGNLRPEQGG